LEAAADTEGAGTWGLNPKIWPLWVAGASLWLVAPPLCEGR
jgi:hypothetical protein